MSIKWTLRIATLLMLIIQLVACGGGSGSEDSKKSVDVDPQDLIVLEKPVYSGNQQPANISQAAATDLVYDILFNLDFIKLMTFGETYQGFSFFYDNSIPVAGDAEVNCQSGSAAVKETVPNKQLLVSYDRCVQGKVELNGSMKLRLNGYITDVLPALDIAPELEFKELDSGEVISMSGYVQTSSASDMDEANATLYLLLTNSDGQQIHFDGFGVFQGSCRVNC